MTDRFSVFYDISKYIFDNVDVKNFVIKIQIKLEYNNIIIVK